MLHKRPSTERGHANLGWLDSYHSFSFGSYFDPDNMSFRALRVINQDIIQAKGGFPTHPHQDMEIISYMISGSLEHKDSIHGSGRISQGSIQHMSAGSGIKHSEWNPSATESAHLLQIWLEPRRSGIDPVYQQCHYTHNDSLTCIASEKGGERQIAINQDCDIYTAVLLAQTQHHIAIADTRHLWIQLISGSIRIENEVLHAGDALTVSEQSAIEILVLADAEILVFDLQ